MIRRAKERADKLLEAAKEAEMVFRSVCISVHEELGLGPKDGIDINAGTIVRTELDQ